MKISLILALFTLSYSIFAASFPEEYCIRYVSAAECRQTRGDIKDCELFINALSRDGSKTMIKRVTVDDAEIPGDLKIMPGRVGNQYYYRIIEDNGRLEAGMKTITNKVQNILNENGQCTNFIDDSKNVRIF